MMHPFKFMPVALCLAVFLPLPGFAAGDAIDKPAAMAAMEKTNPNVARLQDMARDLYNSMNQDEAKRLVAVRTGFGMIRSVETAGQDIDAGRKQCAQANPGMAADLDRRYRGWRDTVQPAVDNQVRRMQAAIAKNNFDDPGKVRAFLDQLDKVAQFAHDQNDKNLQRVTTATACKGLAQSMTDNAPVLAGALAKISWPGEPGYGR